MSKVLHEVLNANERYAGSFGDKASLAMPPARRFAILTCMDARLDPAKFLNEPTNRDDLAESLLHIE